VSRLGYDFSRVQVGSIQRLPELQQQENQSSQDEPQVMAKPLSIGSSATAGFIQAAPTAAPSSQKSGTVSKDVDILARTLWGEARGENTAGRIGVGSVIRNRAARSPKYGWPSSIAGVCQQPWQFSCWNANDPNLPKMRSVTEADPIFKECLSIAQKIVDGSISDNTNGADHYYANYIKAPDWAQGKTPCAKIGVHLFFNIVGGPTTLPSQSGSQNSTSGSQNSTSGGSKASQESTPQNSNASGANNKSGSGKQTLKLTNPYMKGEDVKEAQQRLTWWGIPVDIDGIYGPDTKAAVEKFQRKKGLEVDGVVGPQTWAALTKASNNSGNTGSQNGKGQNGGKQNAPQQNAPKQDSPQQEDPKNKVNAGSINWNDTGAKISNYFTVGEVTKGDPKRIPKDPNMAKRIVDFAQELDRVRDAWGSGLGVTSWYRPPDVNKAIGGATNSQHIQGWAADVYPTNGKLGEFQSWIDKKWNGGLGYGAHKGFVHLDARSGFPCFGNKSGGARWDY
jgi:putative chitinase